MKRQRVDHAAVIDELHTRLTEQVGAMTSTDEWLAYLQAARAFHRYSPQNQMLLALQGAQGYVASYRNWTRIPATEGGNCQVAKGQKGLVILAPMVSKSVEVDDDTGEETSRKRLRGFRTVKVFHQGQLVSPPAIPEPQMPELLTGDNRWQHVWAAVVGQLEDDGYTVTLHSRTPIEKWNGMTTWGERSVKVADDLEPPQRIKTLLHEWAHVQLGHEHRLGAERDTKEVEAESVAYLLSQTIGLDSQSYSIPYVTGWAGGDVELVQSTAEAVLTTTKRLVDILETDLGIELTPDALDHAIPVDNVTELRAADSHESATPQAADPTAVETVEQSTLALTGMPSERAARPGLDPATMTHAEFVLAVKNRLEPEPARRLMAIVYEPESAGEAAVLMAEAGITAGQTVRVLRHLGVDDSRIRTALATPTPHDAEQPELWPADAIAVALGDEPALHAESRIVRAEDRANHDLIVQTYRTAEPARVAALAYGLGIECDEVIRLCANSRPDPTAAFEIAISMHPGDTDAATAVLRRTWPNPPGGWDAYLPSLTPAATAASAEVDDYASTQAILDEWYGLDSVAAPTPTPEHSIT